MTSHEQGGAAAELLLPLCRTGRDDDTPLESLIFFFSSLLSLSLLLFFFFFSGLYNNNNNKCCLSLSSPLSNETKFDNSILNKNFDFLFLFPPPPLFLCVCVCVCVCEKKKAIWLLLGFAGVLRVQLEASRHNHLCYSTCPLLCAGVCVCDSQVFLVGAHTVGALQEKRLC